MLLAEAGGHGLEGDFNRKGTWASSEPMDERVAASGVTVFDDGANRRSERLAAVDDEGTRPTGTVLIRDGILVGYGPDRGGARLGGGRATGKGLGGGNRMLICRCRG